MNDTIQLTPAMLGMVPVVALVLQIIKKLPFATKVLPYMPIISIGVGIGAALATSIANPIVAGVLIGVAASAGYDQFKKINGAK
jgi:hypothetical protein